MIECVSKEYMRDIVRDRRDNACGAECYAYNRVLEDIDEAPIVKAKRGRWMSTYPVTCSACGGPAATDYEDANTYEAWLSSYCPNCGAQMSGD